jgi:glycosyltransferase involved in cell wall biosynthesis
MSSRMNNKILIGVPPKEHVLLAWDEVEGLKENGFDCITVPYSRNDQTLGVVNKLLGVIGRAFGVVRALYRHKPDILYLNSRIERAGSTRDFISLLIIKLFYYRKLKVAIKSHGSELDVVTGNSFFFRSLVTPFLVKRVHAWFLLSNDEKSIIATSNRAMASRLHVTANIIDPNRSEQSELFRNQYGINDQRFTILYAGRMIEKKGIFYILKAIELLPFKEDCLFVMVGSGPAYPELVNRAKAAGVDKYIVFTGFIPDVECNHFYANTNVLLYPTYDSEGFPMAIFKAIAAGQPVITTQIRAAKDHLQAPNNVLWVEPESAESIAEAITRLYNDNALRQTMREANLRIGKRFSKESICANMSIVFRSL